MQIMTLAERLLRALTPGARTEKTMLATALDVATGDLDRTVTELSTRGIALRDELHYLTLTQPISLINAEEISALLAVPVAQVLRQIEVLWETESTNQSILDRWPTPVGAHGHVCIAEFQTRGRGRLGRAWQAPLGGSLCISLGWRITSEDNGYCGPLSLGIGVAIIRLLRNLGIDSAQLKWPNDVLIAGRKLGGILIESRPCSTGLGMAIGVGLNVDLTGFGPSAIDQAYVDLLSVMSCLPSRSELASRLLEEVVAVLDQFEHGHTDTLLDEWRHYDASAGKHVRLQQGQTVVDGIASGVDADGALLLRRNDRLEAFHVGDVSLRKTP
jgi:BirA family transcriptional regulator, biotin operon repressor / biotin---[acetyl-CoA-carboxylase] ligase